MSVKNRFLKNYKTLTKFIIELAEKSNLPIQYLP